VAAEIRGVIQHVQAASGIRINVTLIKSMITFMTAVGVAMLLIGCSPSRQDGKQPSISDGYQIGETVYVCGCPMMCCNSLSREPGGWCLCNMPLRKGIVSKIQDHILIVKVSGREKIIFLKNR